MTGKNDMGVSRMKFQESEHVELKAMIVDDIKKDLELKKSETKRKQKQLDDLQRQAEDDPSKQAELQKAKAKVAQLKKETEKLKSQTYSA